MIKVKSAKIHKFWIPTLSSVGTARYRNFVAKSDYDALMKLYKQAVDKPVE